MGKKQRQWDAALAQMQAMFQQAQQPSAFETQYQNEWNNIGSWLNKKDYRNLPDSVNVDLLPIAEYQKMRQMTRGNDGGGQMAKGANNTALMRQQRELGDNQFVQDWGNAYENKVGEIANRRDSLGNVLMSSDANRKQLGISGSQAYLQALGPRPRSMWSSLLPSMIQGGAQVVSSIRGI